MAAHQLSGAQGLATRDGTDPPAACCSPPPQAAAHNPSCQMTESSQQTLPMLSSMQIYTHVPFPLPFLASPLTPPPSSVFRRSGMPTLGTAPSPFLEILWARSPRPHCLFSLCAHASGPGPPPTRPPCCRSRLGCQIVACKELDGLVVRIPSATRNMAVDGFRPKPH